MPGNSFGQLFKLTSWGESHGPAIGGVVDGVPPGIDIDTGFIQQQLDLRRPGSNIDVTPRQEEDRVEILSGVFEGKTTGTPIGFMIANTDQRSHDYGALRDVFRPGHGDYTYHAKYGHRDFRGGGRSSARETAVRVAAGAIAEIVLRQLLGKDFQIRGAVTQIGNIPADPKRFDWDQVQRNRFFSADNAVLSTWGFELEKAKEAGRSLGALIEVQALGVPAGLGEPVFDRLDADLAKALMSINAVKGVEIGEGFASVSASSGFDEMKREHDPRKPGFLSNKAGGILAGISTGEPIVCTIALKPTSSTAQPRRTVDMQGNEQMISIGGRHDPCVGLRAVPIARAMMALTLADHLLRWRGQCGIPLSG